MYAKVYTLRSSHVRAGEFTWLLLLRQRSDLLALSSIPRVGHPRPAGPCGRRMRWIAFGSGTKRTARCHAHMSKSGRVRVVMGLRLFPVPRAACVCGPLPQQKQYTMCKRAFQHSLPPQAQGSTGLVVAFKARHGSAITNAIMGQPQRPNLRQSQDHAVAPSTAQSLMARVCLCVCIVRFLSKLAPKDEIRS